MNCKDTNIRNIDILSGYAAEAAGYKGLLSRPMLSAVENHMGPGRPYFAGPTFPQLLQPVPQVQIPTGLPGAAVAMQAAEFVRPHPKR